MKVAEAIARAVRAEGVTDVFGLMGDGNMDFMAAFREVAELGVSVWDARHEGAAVGMADGHQRAKGGVGVASVTNGPGVTQLGTALTVASRHRTPLVVVAGDTMTSLKGAGISNQDLDQQRFTEATGAIFCGLRAAATFGQDVQRAFWLARTQRMPVLLSCPIDIQEAEVVGAFAYIPSTARIAVLPPLLPDPSAIEKAGDILANARRPIFVAGAGALASGAGKAIVALGERVGAAFATTLWGKGALGDQWSIGIFGTFTTAAADPVIDLADTVVLIGSSVTADVAAAIPSGARTIVINIDPRATVNGRQADCLVVADARLAVEALDALIADAGFSAPGFRGGQYDDLFRVDGLALDLEQATWPTPDGMVDPRRAVAELDRTLPDDCMVVVGAGHFFSIPATYLSAKQRRFIYTYDFGCIGQAIPIAFGVAIAEGDRPVVVFEGDTSFFMNIHELDTIGRYQPRLLVIVMNDGALGAEYHKLKKKKHDPELAVLPSPDFAAVAAGFGNQSGTVTSLHQIEREVGAFRDGSGARVVDIRTSKAVVSRFYRRTVLT